MARIPKPPNTIQDQVEALAAINCTWKEISFVTGIPISSAKRKYGTNYRKGKYQGKTQLKKRMYEIAMNGNITMLIFLSKQMLGYADKIDAKTKVVQKLDVHYQAVLGNILPLITTDEHNKVNSLQPA